MGHVTRTVDSSRSSSRQIFAAFQSSLKSIVGTGVIALPYGTKSAGWALASVGMVIVAVLSAYTIQLLIASMRRVQHHRTLNGEEDLAEVTFRDIAFAATGRKGMIFSDIILIVVQLGSGIAMAAFIARNFAHVIGSSMPHAHLFSLILITPVILVPSLLKSTEYLAPLSVIGNLLFVFAFIMLIYFGASQTDPQFGEIKAVDFSGIPNFFGVSLFAFTAHAELMAIAEFLPEHIQDRFNSIIWSSVMTALALFMTFGVSSYLFFREDTEDDIFLNIDCSVITCSNMSEKVSHNINRVVVASTAAMVMINYPFTVYGALQNIEEMIWGQEELTKSHLSVQSSTTDPHEFHALEAVQGPQALPTSILHRFTSIFVVRFRLVCRTLIVLATVVLAGVIPNFGFLTSVTGCLTGIFAFSLPPLFYLHLFQEDINSYSLAWQRVIKGLNWFLVIGGGVVSAIFTVMVIVKEVKG